MIKYKEKECILCKRMTFIFSKGRCKSCAASSYKSKPKKESVTRVSPSTAEKKEIKRQALDVFFTYHISRCTKSEETGKFIYNPTRANICHLFPKSTHKSVMANLNNVIYLTLEEHTRFDELLFRKEFRKLEQEFPNAWKIARKRMLDISHLVLEKTSLFISFMEYVENLVLSDN